MSAAPVIEKIPIAISSCLLGQEVRYDGGHKHNGYITQSLGRYFEYLPFCPEVAIGLGIPRPAIQLVQVENTIRVRSAKDPGLDVTEQLQDYARSVVPALAGVCGYIFKRASPSCGMERVKVYKDGNLYGNDQGVYAATIMQALPNLPAEEEGRLMDPVLRENFIERVFVYHRWQQLLRDGLSAQALVDFHTIHKFSLLAHDEISYRELGKLVAVAGSRELEQLAAEYLGRMMRALATPATRKTHTNVLMHIMGYLKTKLTAGDKQELLEILDKYRLGQVPLIVPITLFRHFLRRFPDEYIQQQVYLSPHPDELMLRNSL
jgi:uncharacterized protein YbgA (DUF1722 family)/uncharacterized protein YbbK (DUF523 family)